MENNYEIDISKLPEVLQHKILLYNIEHRVMMKEVTEQLKYYNLRYACRSTKCVKRIQFIYYIMRDKYICKETVYIS